MNALATRRAMLASAVGIPFAVKPIVVVDDRGLWRTWLAYRALKRHVDSTTWVDSRDDELDAMTAHEDAIYYAPITCRQDAIAKLCVSGLIHSMGERTDGSDERAYDAAVAWLEAN